MDVAGATAPPAALKVETLQNAILNSANFAIIATDATGIIQLFNIGAERLLGYSAGDVVDKMTPSDIHDPQEVIARADGLSVEFATTIAPGFEALAFKASRGIEDRYELTYIRKDGSRFPAHVSITALRDNLNAVIGYLLIGADNSAAQLAVTAAAKEKLAQEMFHHAVESCPSGMVIVNGAGQIVLVNIETERLFGYRRDELIGQPINILVPARQRSQHAKDRKEYAHHPAPRHAGAGRELFGLRKDGTEFEIEVGLNPITTGEGLMVLSVIVDVSERRPSGSSEGRVCLHCEPRVAHAADLDLRLARPAGRGRGWNAPGNGHALAQDRPVKQPKAGPARQRYSRCRENGIEPESLQFCGG
jgi:PAS domain S-box-containing protein